MRLLTLSALLALAGCSQTPPAPRLRPVEGMVTVNGQPLRFGTVVFENPDTEEFSTALMEADGTYTVHSAGGLGLPAGTYRVAIIPGRMLAPGDGAGLADVNVAPPPKKGPRVPAKFHTAATSGLTITVADGDNPPFDFHLAE